jgi:hypothetical protein
MIQEVIGWVLRSDQYWHSYFYEMIGFGLNMDGDSPFLLYGYSSSSTTILFIEYLYSL